MAHLLAGLEHLRMRKDERGQAMIEYASILMLVAIVAVLVLQGIGADVNHLYQYALDSFPAP
jgi:Flp pilus assembly pilin Flp